MGNNIVMQGVRTLYVFNTFAIHFYVTLFGFILITSTFVPESVWGDEVMDMSAGPYRGLVKLSDSKNLELRAFVSLFHGCWNQTQVLCRAASP